MIKKEHYAYYQALETIRQLGITNMYGAAPYLQEAFPSLSAQEAREILTTWMSHYEELLDLGVIKRN